MLMLGEEEQNHAGQEQNWATTHIAATSLMRGLTSSNLKSNNISALLHETDEV